MQIKAKDVVRDQHSLIQTGNAMTVNVIKIRRITTQIIKYNRGIIYGFLEKF